MRTLMIALCFGLISTTAVSAKTLNKTTVQKMKVQDIGDNDDPKDPKTPRG